MRISELSRRSGVPVATIKYYLREGLLPKGEATSSTQAVYGETHLRRLRLVRALVEVADAPLAKVRAALEAIDDPDTDVHTLLGSAQHTFHPDVPEPGTDDPGVRDAEERTDALLAELGWRLIPHSPFKSELTRAIAAMGRLGRPVTDEMLRTYAAAARTVAEQDVRALDPAGSREDMVEYAVVVSAVMERALTALRLLAQEDASARLFDRGRCPEKRPPGTRE
ncbi:DNA-binding transcriptional MerR regulator [Nocardiopsis mwathae]|uniref:DNA-binding transcriptional MerR regulator n=1 Tax=Nocardiopsis mwathae TaxID=1472723 RepID=A0A7W9YE77_9ACTN|nr:MerR family transcriptional regulator [Nocardiopsis mwathae]MBB6170444.1 DNA-binding transcriptional MerR regulator [Nocardiopsis mwathae]